MKLLYDLYSLYSGSSPIHGGGIYGISFFNEAMPRLRERLGDGISLSACIPKGVETDPKIVDTMASCRIEALPVGSESEIRGLVDSDEFDVYYSALPYTLPRMFKEGRKGSRTRIAGTVHGLRDLEFQYDEYFRAYLTEPRDRLKHWAVGLIDERRKERRRRRFSSLFALLGGRILTVSNHTKYRITSEFPTIRPSDISVVYSLEEERAAPELEGKSIKEELGRLGLESRRYFLMVGCDRPVKNALRVLAALENYRVEGAGDFRFACLGFTQKQRERVLSRFPRASKLVTFLPYVSSEVLTLLYKEAFCFIYPSISEGFGYPPLEAMRFGTPVLASGLASIPEVCGDAAVYVNPYDPGEIAARVSMMIAEGGLREELSRRGPVRYRYFRDQRPAQVEGFIRYLLEG
jgi:glycosyltransferase involved in cell wall biosynthesis